MPDTVIYTILGVAALAALLVVLILIAKGRLKALKPLIKEIIIKVEIWAQDENLEKAGVEKMAKVISEVIKLLPSWVIHLMPTGYIDQFCQVVFDSIQDKLVELCEEYRKAHLEDNKEIK